MAQFDVMISFSLLFNLLLVLYIYYFYNIKVVIPSYTETKKFRSKIFLALYNVKNITSSGLYASILDFKYFKGFVQKIKNNNRGCNSIGRVYALQA